LTSFTGDIRDLDKLSGFIQEVQPEIVIHMAAQPLVRQSYKVPVETYSINVMGTVHLLEACRCAKSVRAIVNVTTDKCYENREWHWGYRESEPMGGFDPYSNSKGCSELVTSAYRSSYFNPKDYNVHKVALASARAGNVIGGGDWAEDRLVPDIIKSICKGEMIKLRSPYSVRPWQHVLEPLSGYLTLASKLYNGGVEYAQAWNFGPDDNDAKSVEWITKTLCKLWGGKVSYKVDISLQPHEANYLKLDCSKVKAEIEWFPRWNIEIALDSVVSWYKSWLKGENVRMVTEEQINQYFNFKNTK
jgi:CDP-glucose 4,6-dehydratase